MPKRAIPGFVPRPARARVDIEAKIEPMASAPVEARVRNLSWRGFHAECSAPLPIGATIIVSAPGLGELPAQVRWALGNRIGAQFHGPLADPARETMFDLLGPDPAYWPPPAPEREPA